MSKSHGNLCPSLSAIDTQVLNATFSNLEEAKLDAKSPSSSGNQEAFFRSFQLTMPQAESPRMVLFHMYVANHHNWQSFPGPVLKAFRKWLESTREKTCKKEPIELAVKSQVFSMFKHARPTSVLNDAFHIFRLKESNIEMKPLVQEILDTEDFIRAAEIVSALKLQVHFNLADLPIPLMLCNPSQEITLDYFRGSPEKAAEIVKWMDDLDLTALNNVAKSYKKSSKIDLVRLGSHNKPKLIQWFVSKFGLDIAAVAPKLVKEKEYKDLLYWIRQRTSGMGYQNWRDLIRKKVEGKKHLQIALMESLLGSNVNYYNDDEAVLWAKELDINENSLQLTFQVRLQEARAAGRGQIDLMDYEPCVEQNFHPLKLAEDCIIFVDSSEEFSRMLSYLQTKFQLAFDCEFNEGKVALMQIACKERVYLLDMLELTSAVSVDKWSEFRDNILATEASTNNLLTFDPRGDFTNLANTLPSVFGELNGKSKRVTNVLDMKIFVECLEEEKILSFKPGVSSSKGLAGMTERILGAPLDKRDQMSDWAKRPLRQSQKIYAALDAYVLIEIQDKLVSMVQHDDELNNKFSKLESALMKNQNKRGKEKKTKKKSGASRQFRSGVPAVWGADREDNSITINGELDPPDLRVVCDKMLEGLCKKLRLMGVDAKSIEQTDHWETCAQIAAEEDRKILTFGRNRQSRLTKLVTNENCLFLTGSTLEEQYAEVFHHFKVRHAKEFIFSRCIKCNNSNFVNFARSEVKALKLSKSSDFKFDQVPDSVIERNEKFYGCPTCRQLFWEGSHWDRAVR